VGQTTMPKKSKELSALSVAKIKETGRHAVGGVDGFICVMSMASCLGFTSAVGKNVDKDGKLKPHRRDIGIGSYPEVSLAEARAKAAELKTNTKWN
jgi:hypothetical protein